MKKQAMYNPDSEPDEMLPEYDLAGKTGVKGKYAKALQAGHTIRRIHEDGSVTTHHFTLEDGAVLLDPDVREFFPDSESVNQALRSLIALIPRKSAKKIASPRQKKRSARL